MTAMKGMIIRIFQKVNRGGRKLRAKAAWPMQSSLSARAFRRLQRHLNSARRLDPKYLTVVRRTKIAPSRPTRMISTSTL